MLELISVIHFFDYCKEILQFFKTFGLQMKTIFASVVTLTSRVFKYMPHSWSAITPQNAHCGALLRLQELLVQFSSPIQWHLNITSRSLRKTSSSFSKALVFSLRKCSSDTMGLNCKQFMRFECPQWAFWQSYYLSLDVFLCGWSWPQYSPDLNPCNHVLWGCLKDSVYRNNPHTIVILKEEI